MKLTEEEEVEMLKMLREDKIKVELTRGQRGGYGWAIRLKGNNMAEVIGDIQLANDKMKKAFGG